MMIFLFPPLIAHCQKAAVYFTTSKGDSDSPGFPPMVPLIPDILFMSDKLGAFVGANLRKING